MAPRPVRVRGNAKESKNTRRCSIELKKAPEGTTAHCSVPKDSFQTSHAEPSLLETPLSKERERNLYAGYFLLSALFEASLSHGALMPQLFWVWQLNPPFTCQGSKSKLSEPHGFPQESRTGARRQSLHQSLGVTEAMLKPDPHPGEAVLTGSLSSKGQVSVLSTTLKWQ